MTLQNGMKDAAKAYLWADTGYWDAATGNFAGHDVKMMRGKDWPWAVSFTTWGGAARSLIEEISWGNLKGLDSLLASCVEGLREHVRRGGGGRILVASYEEAPRLHMIACHEVFPGSGYGPFEPTELEFFVCSGVQLPACKRAVAEGFTPERMRAVIDAQCVTPWEAHGALAHLGERVWIAGNVIRVEVGADGVTSEVERAV